MRVLSVCKLDGNGLTRNFPLNTLRPRLPGMDSTPSANFLLETVNGTDTTLDFSDTLNLKENRVEAPRLTLHKAMEQKMGL